MLLERIDGDKVTRVVIDTSPDFREQMLDAGVETLDGVVFTHAHADHVHGLDDLRMIVINRRERLPVWADAATSAALTERFSYAFVQAEGSTYPPILDLHALDGPVAVPGPAGPLELTPFQVGHGAIHALGFRIGGLAYLPDVSEMTADAWAAVTGADVWILDALRYTPHPTHVHYDRALEWIARAAPTRAVLTNMHIDLDHATVQADTPAHVDAAFDGMTLTLPVP